MGELRRFKNSITIKAGLTAGLAMICFFLVARFFHFDYLIELHFLNILFIAPAIWYVVWKRSGKVHKTYPYLSGFIAGIKATTIAALLANFFILIFLRFIDKGFMAHLVHDTPLGEYMSPLIISLVLFTEQVCAGLILSLIFMQLYKPEKDRNA